MPARLSAIATLVVAGLMTWFVATNLSVTTDITHFLPGGDEEDDPLATLSRQLADSPLTRTVVISLRSDEGEKSRSNTLEAAGQLANRIEEMEEVAWIQQGVDGADQDAVYDLYFPRRWYFLSRSEEVRAKILSDDGLRKEARALLDALQGPRGPLIRRIAEDDPLLIFPDILKRLESMRRGELSVEKGHFITEDGWAILILATRSSPFDSAAMRPFARNLQGAIDEVRQEKGPSLQIEQSGVYRFALSSEDSIRSDVTRISIASTVGILLLFIVVFRVFRYTLLGFVPLGMGVLTGISVGLAVFGELHGLTLAFGSALIGVVIDYPVHYFNHHSLQPQSTDSEETSSEETSSEETSSAERSPEATARRIWPALLLGASTTVAGFVGLAFTSFPGLREMAVFAAAGVFAALLVTRYVLPVVMPEDPPCSRLQQALATRLGKISTWLANHRPWLFALPLAAVILGAVGVPAVSWVDDPAALNEVDPELQAEEEQVRARVSQMDMGRFVVAVGSDDEQALRRYESAHDILQSALRAGELDDAQSLIPLLWSRETQERNQQAIVNANLPKNLPVAYQKEGFSENAFSELDPTRNQAKPLSPQALLESPLARLASGFRVELDSGVAYLAFVRGVVDPAALEARVESLDGVHFFDQSRFLSATYETVRERTLQMILLGLLAVFAVLFWRYRNWRIVLAAFFPSVLAAAATLGVLGLLGQDTHMLHVVSLLLVLSIGVDYSVFLAESHQSGEGYEATLLSIVMACASTLLAFGLLAMSDMPALEAIGSTVGIGVLFSLLLAPSAMLIASGPAADALIPGSSTEAGDTP